MIGQVQQANSDARSQDFQQNVLPAFQTFIDKNLKESQSYDGVVGSKLDPTKLILILPPDKTIRAYFMYEGALYRNQLGVAISDAGHGQNGSTPLADPLQTGKLIFPDASFKNPPDGLYQGGPLNQGDFVDLGTVAQGKQLDFFLVSNGAGDTLAGSGETDKKNVLRNFSQLNSDNLQHVIAYYRDDMPGYLLIGFEDIVGGGDLDYNDCLFVIDVGYNFQINPSDLPD